jgi:hypothetical protein
MMILISRIPVNSTDDRAGVFGTWRVLKVEANAKASPYWFLKIDLPMILARPMTG